MSKPKSAATTKDKKPKIVVPAAPVARVLSHWQGGLYLYHPDLTRDENYEINFVDENQVSVVHDGVVDTRTFLDVLPIVAGQLTQGFYPQITTEALVCFMGEEKPDGSLVNIVAGDVITESQQIIQNILDNFDVDGLDSIVLPAEAPAQKSEESPEELYDVIDEEDDMQDLDDESSDDQQDDEETASATVSVLDSTAFIEGVESEEESETALTGEICSSEDQYDEDEDLRFTLAFPIRRAQGVVEVSYPDGAMQYTFDRNSSVVQTIDEEGVAKSLLMQNALTHIALADPDSVVIKGKFQTKIGNNTISFATGQDIVAFLLDTAFNMTSDGVSTEDKVEESLAYLGSVLDNIKKMQTEEDDSQIWASLAFSGVFTYKSTMFIASITSGGCQVAAYHNDKESGETKKLWIRDHVVDMMQEIQDWSRVRIRPSAVALEYGLKDPKAVLVSFNGHEPKVFTEGADIGDFIQSVMDDVRNKAENQFDTIARAISAFTDEIAEIVED